MLDYGVSASSVHPGGIKTSIARSSRMDDSIRDLGLGREGEDAREKLEKSFITSADDAAKTIIEGVRRNQRRILVGPDARVYDWMVRLLPTGYQRVAVRYARFTTK
jgi:short-subunit dehydrogenase